MTALTANVFLSASSNAAPVSVAEHWRSSNITFRSHNRERAELYIYSVLLFAHALRCEDECVIVANCN